MRVHAAIVLATAVLLFWSQDALAQGPITNARYFNPNGFTSWPTMTQNGGLVTTFLSSNSDTSIDDIFISKSSDGGATWSDPERVASAGPSSFFTDVKSASADGHTYVVWKLNGAFTAKVQMSDCDIGTGTCTPPVDLGEVRGDGVPEIAAGQGACPEPGLVGVTAVWSDFSDSISGQGDAFVSQFIAGHQPPAQPTDLGPTTASITTAARGEWSAYAREGEIVVAYQRKGYIGYLNAHLPVTQPVGRVAVKITGPRSATVYWETTESPPRVFAVSARQSDLYCDALPGTEPPPELGAVFEIDDIVNPLGFPALATGPGAVAQKSATQGSAGPLDATPPLMVFSWVEACCQGKFHLLNTVSTDGGQTWSPAKEVAPPSDLFDSASVAVLGNTIWNVVGTRVQPGAGGQNEDIAVAASTDGGQTYSAFYITNDARSSLPRPFFLNSTGDDYFGPFAAAPAASPPIILTYTHNATQLGLAGDVAVAPLALVGDANCDNLIDARDALAALREAAGLSSAPCHKGADANCDGVVDARDALEELRFTAGLPINQPSGCPPVGT